jgi:hypothetical protein
MSYLSKAVSGLTRFSAGVCLLYGASTYATPIAVYDSNLKLTGITGVEVTGVGFWDVAFNDIWQGDVYSLDFARLATTSLHDIFSPGGFLSGTAYDLEPTTKILGCLASGGDHCDLFTTVNADNANSTIPYLAGVFWRNFVGPWPSRENPETATLYSGSRIAPDTTSVGSWIHATWDNSRYNSTVPLPGSVWLFVFGLSVLVGFRRFRKDTVEA